MNTGIRTSVPGRGRVAGSVVLLAVLAVAGILPPRATAQLLGSLVVNITSPASGATVGGTVPVSASVTIIGALTVAGVQFKVDGVNLGGEDTTAPYSVPWDTRTAGNGSHTVTAVARAILGLKFNASPVTVTVFNDAAPPSVTVTSPAGGSTVSGTVGVNASASDDAGVAGVHFLLDGASLGAEDTSAPYSVSWDTTAASDGSHTLTAVARDTAGNTTTSGAVTVTVANGGGTVTRIEEADPAVTYADGGTPWTQGNTDRPWSGGTAALGGASGQRATVSFSGTAVAWIGFRGPQAGIAEVALDGTAVATVDLYAPAEAVQAVVFTADDLAPGPHTLAIEATGTQNPSSSNPYVVVDAFDVTAGAAAPSGPSFQSGDLLVSLETGPVQWRLPDGTLNRTLASAEAGTGEGMAFDPGGNLYVARWPVDSAIGSGNTVEVFDRRGEPLGTFGSGYDCAPHAIVFDADGTAYVGQGACTGAVLRFAPGQAPVAFPVAPEHAGSFWIDLSPDGCTILYTSWGPNVKRYDTCTATQLPDFNSAPLPSGAAQDLRVLPDGGVLVSSGAVISRLDASGALVRTYEIPGEASLWAGIDLVGDGTFWAANYEASNLYRFDLATGAVLAGFNTGTPAHTVVAVRVVKP